MESFSQNDASCASRYSSAFEYCGTFNEFLFLFAWQSALNGENQNLFHILCCLAACSLCSDQLLALVEPGVEDGAELLSQHGHFSWVVVLSAFTWDTVKDKTNFYSSPSSGFLIVNQGTQDVMISLRELSTSLKWKLNIWRQRIPCKYQECIAHILLKFFLVWKALWKDNFPLSQVSCDPQVWQIHLYFAEKCFHTQVPFFLTSDFPLNWAALEGENPKENPKEAEPGWSSQKGLPFFY